MARWRLFNTPEFMKIITCRSIIGVAKDYSKFEYGMYEFTDWVSNRLQQIQKDDNGFVVGKEYTLMLDKRDKVMALLDYASFYINMVQDSLTGKCSYAEILKEITPHNDRELYLDAHNIQKKISHEYFVFIDKPVTFESFDTVAFIITKSHRGVISTDRKLEASITIQIVSYQKG